MNELARAAGYYILLKKVGGDYCITVGKGFALTKDNEKSEKDNVYWIKCENEFLIMYKENELGELEKTNIRDLSPGLRNGIDKNELLQEIVFSLIKNMCVNNGIDESFVYYEE